MRCGSFAVSQVLIGLHRVGIVGLNQACEKASGTGLEGREEIVDFLLAELAADNFVPKGQEEAYRVALWREYLRFLGEDFREYFSEVAVTIRGEPGEERDRLVELFASVLAEFELRPIVEFAAADEEGANPHLLIDGDTVARGLPTKRALNATVRQRLSDW